MSISVFKATCLELLQRVKRTGQPILVTRRGEPIAQITPATPQPRARRWLGAARETGKIRGDTVSPLGEADWEVLR